MGGDGAGAAGRTSLPDLSVVVLAWDNLHYTRAFVESARANTDVSYELIVIDNGSQPEAADYAQTAADRAVLNPENRGFAPGMNQGLECARGEYIAFCNNDCLLPPAWASRLVGTARAHPGAGIVVPAITAASNPVTVRAEPGVDISVLDSFSAPPAA
ncbi:MAG TPA: glycosyltransferase, partial [Acidimicrobiia bacterium]